MSPASGSHETGRSCVSVVGCGLLCTLLILTTYVAQIVNPFEMLACDFFIWGSYISKLGNL